MTPGYGQIIYESYRERARSFLGTDILAMSWNELAPDDQECWDGAARDLDEYLRKIPA